MSTINPGKIISGWHSVHEGAEQAIEWINTARGDAPRLNTEADRLIVKLRRGRNKAARLAAAAEKPMTIGFFGLSQAGKSFLISALAAGENGKLETRLGGKQLDFLDHINPAGGGKEATGLVTRFSRHAVVQDEAWPVRLELFSEVEMGKILANAFLHDFNQEKVDWQYDEGRINDLLITLAARRQSRPSPGITADDVVSLWDYLTRHAEKSQSRFALRYWPQAIELAPWLSVEDRARLFSVLWGEIPELTNAYSSFAQTLQRLGGASTVLAPLTTLVREENGKLEQVDSIMNVDMLERLNKSHDGRVEVRPVLKGAAAAPVSLSLAELTALTVELHIPLLSSTREPLFEHVDLLDFPGYRGRLGVESMASVSHAVDSEESNPLAQLVLRGKVAYLFERYTENQEMNVLVVCTASNKQSDVKEVGGVLDEWIRYTQGDAQSRAKRPAGLVWALTMFDLRITDGLQRKEGMLRKEFWNGMIKLAMTERFGLYSWMQEWTPGQTFSNTFLVRKPRQQTPFIRLANGNESEFDAGNQQQLSLLRTTFTEDEAVGRFINKPAEAWDAMISLNDGGMRRMADYLAQVARPEVKLERIAEQLEEMRHELVEGGLGSWFQPDGAEDVAKKSRIAMDILKALQNRTGMHGELLEWLIPSRRALQELYMQETELPVNETSQDNTLTPTFGIGGDFDLFSDTPAEIIPGHSHEQEFARQAIQLWVNHLRGLPESPGFNTLLAVPRPLVETLVDELITALLRMQVEDDLLSVLSGTEQAGIRREKMVERQVTRVLRVLGDFVTWLGYHKIPEAKRPASRIKQGKPIFARPGRSNPEMWKGDERMVRLTSEPENYSAIFIYDWLVGLGEVVRENAGHSAGREISVAQNERLGVIIQHIQSSGSSVL